MWPDPDSSQVKDKTLGGNAAFHNFHNDYVHIVDPNKRRRLALSEIDKVPFGWYHVRTVVVAGIGFFTDSYDIFAINLAIQMLGLTFWQADGGEVPANIQTAIKAATSGGTVIGQILFGWLADVLGRRKMYGIELMTILIATLVQCLSSPSLAVTMTGQLIFWRVIMGIGIGGDYPMSAVITSEFAPTRWRGAMVAAVFSMQGAGQFVAAMVTLITTVAFRESFSNAATFADCDVACQLAADRSWRIIIGFGALPALFALYYRITIPETPRFTFDIAHDIEKADADIKAFMHGNKEGHPDALQRERTKLSSGNSLAQPKATWADFFSYFGQWRNGKVLFATMTSWFFLDLAFYGLGLNNSTILQVIGYASGDTVYHILFNAAVGNLILVCAGAMPGYWLSVFTMDSIGRRPIQIGGFLILTVIFCILGFGYSALNRGSILAMYVLAQLFFNFGPNTTTFIVPGEVFPTRYRATAHGLSAASGKVGAIIASVIAQPLLTIGAQPGLSIWIPETKGKSLEELAGEPTPKPRAPSTASRSPKLFSAFAGSSSPIFTGKRKSRDEGNGKESTAFSWIDLDGIEPPGRAAKQKGRNRQGSDLSNEGQENYQRSVSSTAGMMQSQSPGRSESNSSGKNWPMDVTLQDLGGLAKL